MSASPITIMSLAAHPQLAFVPTSPKSVTMLPPGGVEPKLGDQAKGDPVDVTGVAMLILRLFLASTSEARPQHETHPYLFVSIETAAAEDGEWRHLHTFAPATLDPSSPHYAGRDQKVTLTEHDAFVRSSHYFVRRTIPHTTERDGVSMTWSLTGTSISHDE